MSDELYRRIAELAVAFGANVQPDQVVRVQADLGHLDMARLVAEVAYRRGARFVDAAYFDPWLKRARIEHAPDDTLEFVPSWYGEAILSLARERGALIRPAGLTAPEALQGLDPERAGRDQLPFLRENLTVINERSVNWTIFPAPTRDWARVVYPSLGPAEALERLRRDVERALRLDEDDPVSAWEARMSQLQATAQRLDSLELDAVRFEGPGTELEIGLLPGSVWRAASLETVDGVVHHPNLPSEEVFTTPDPERAEGSVRSTRPLVLNDGTLVDGLELRFEGGRAVEISATTGEGVLRGRAALDEGAARLGEVALVDRESRVGSLGTVFSSTLLDENAASHVAIGSGIDWAVTEASRSRVNRSAIHIDFMIGGDDVAVTGITRAGERVPLLRDGAWQLGHVGTREA